MLFAAEMPLSWMLKYHDEFNDYLYVLLHLFVSNEEYKKFCLEYRKRPNSFILLDNSAYEMGEAMDNKLLFDVVEQLQPDYVMLPDKINDQEFTLDKSIQFVDTYELIMPSRTKFMGIIQGKTDEEMMMCHDRFMAINVRDIGIPFIFYDTPKESLLQAWRRMEFLKRHARVLSGNNYTHLLGTWCVGEFVNYKLRGYNWINSFDTSNPIMAALEGTSYGLFGTPNKPKTKLDDVFLKSENELSYALDTARNNVRILRESI